MCSEQMKILISGHLDGCNTPKQEALLSEHLAQCPECRRLLDDYKTIDAGIAGFTQAPPASFTDSVMHAITQDVSRSKKTRNHPFRYGTAVAAVAAVLILSVSAGYIALPKVGSAAIHPSPAPEEAQDMEAPEAENYAMADQATLETKSASAYTEPLPANVDCAALASTEGCYVGLLYDSSIPQALENVSSLPLSGGMMYTIPQSTLNDLKEQFPDLQIYKPDDIVPDEDADAYLILVTEPAG